MVTKSVVKDENDSTDTKHYGYCEDKFKTGQGQWFPKTLVPPLLDSGSQDTGSQGQ